MTMKEEKFEIRYEGILEKDKEYCAVCHEEKNGKFFVFTFGDTYIPICESCALKKPEKGEYKHIDNKGWMKWGEADK